MIPLPVERSTRMSPAAFLFEIVRFVPLKAICAALSVTPLSLARITLLDPLLEIRSTSTSLYFLISIAFVGADVPIPMRWFELSTANAVPLVPTNNCPAFILVPTFRFEDTLTRLVAELRFKSPLLVSIVFAVTPALSSST